MDKKRLQELAGIEQLDEWPTFGKREDTRSLAARVYDRLRHVRGSPMSNPEDWSRMVEEVRQMVLAEIDPQERQDIEDSLLPPEFKERIIAARKK